MLTTAAAAHQQRRAAGRARRRFFGLARLRCSLLVGSIPCCGGWTLGWVPFARSAARPRTRLAVRARQCVAPAPRRHDGPSWDPASRTKHKAGRVPWGLDRPPARGGGSCRGPSRRWSPAGRDPRHRRRPPSGASGVAPGGRDPIAPAPSISGHEIVRVAASSPSRTPTWPPAGTPRVSLVASRQASSRPPAHGLPPACRGSRSRSARAATASRGCRRPPGCRRTRRPDRAGRRRCRWR